MVSVSEVKNGVCDIQNFMFDLEDENSFIFTEKGGYFCRKSTNNMILSFIK